MKKEFETSVTGPDGPVYGIVSCVNADEYVYEFKSIDGSLDLVIQKDEDGTWWRIDGNEPYLSSWIDELGEQITS